MPPTLSYPHQEDVLLGRSLPASAPLSKGPTEEAQTRDQSIVEAWAQGFNVGSVVILILIVLCNYRKGVLLHKLILLELFFALWHGTFIFFRDPVYGWYLSGTAVFLYLSYTLHNIVSWLKIKPFLPRWGGRFFIVTLLLVQPYWVLETFANFEYFNSLSEKGIFHTTRFLEPAMRDPWWIFTTVKLCTAIRTNYELGFFEFMRVSPRFAVLLTCMFLSIVFLVTDVIINAKVSTQSGINPFWRLALVFKCASDTIFLDDFKSVLDQIVRSFMGRIANVPETDYDPSNNSRDGTSRHLSFSQSRGRHPSSSENLGAHGAITSQSRPGAAAARKKPSRRFWRLRKRDHSSGGRRGGGGGGGGTPDSIRKPSESGDSNLDGPHVQQFTTVEYQERSANARSRRTSDVGRKRAGHHHNHDTGRDPFDSAGEEADILPRYSNGNKGSAAPVVADFEWAMAQEDMVRRGTLDGETGERTELGTQGILMRPMKARTTGSVF